MLQNVTINQLTKNQPKTTNQPTSKSQLTKKPTNQSTKKSTNQLFFMLNFVFLLFFVFIRFLLFLIFLFVSFIIFRSLFSFSSAFHYFILSFFYFCPHLLTNISFYFKFVLSDFHFVFVLSSFNRFFFFRFIFLSPFHHSLICHSLLRCFVSSLLSFFNPSLFFFLFFF